MDIFEYAEVRCPARTFQQDEEEAARATAAANLEPPAVLWNRGLRQQLFPGGIVVDLLVIAVSKPGCALVSAAYPTKQVLGSLLLPDVPLKGNCALPSQPSAADKTCLIYCCGGPHAAAPTTLLVSCQYDVPAHRAVAVCKALMGEVCPKQVLVFGSMQAQSFHGEGDPSQEPLVFRLHTQAAAAAAAAAASSETSSQAVTRPPPLLPTGNVVGGLAAALLSYCQVRQMSAELIVSLEMVPSLASLVLQPLAQAAAAVLQAAGASVGAALCSKPTLAAALTAMQGAPAGAVYT